MMRKDPKESAALELSEKHKIVEEIVGAICQFPVKERKKILEVFAAVQDRMSHVLYTGADLDEAGIDKTLPVSFQYMAMQRQKDMEKVCEAFGMQLQSGSGGAGGESLTSAVVQITKRLIESLGYTVVKKAVVKAKKA